MFGRWVPREENFFALFREMADLIVEGGEEFTKLLHALPNGAARAATVKDLEHKADKITHKTVELLHKTFITPLDREDIYSLICRLDDILDFIDAAAQRLVLFDLKKTTPEADALARICVESGKKIRIAVNGLSDLTHPDETVKACIEINQLENEADTVLRAAVARLFKEEPDTRELIKWKEVYELLETVTDRCEDVANVIDGIVLEYA